MVYLSGDVQNLDRRHFLSEMKPCGELRVGEGDFSLKD